MHVSLPWVIVWTMRWGREWRWSFLCGLAPISHRISCSNVAGGKRTKIPTALSRKRQVRVPAARNYLSNTMSGTEDSSSRRPSIRNNCFAVRLTFNISFSHQRSRGHLVLACDSDNRNHDEP